ncbi:YitT family protein [uncultured Desulfovibrio sp.]|uniref:YitT family protein n=1 Tax=uncultured Desulfovibrio sp. TaxID=167968 RepID=UPI002630A7E2|nr:YitT family protein [uncultured Desulfovibrio sp.]
MLTTYNRKRTESVWWNLLWLTVGAFLMTVCVQGVAAPHNFLAGGVMGVALLLTYWAHGLPPLVWYLALCLPIYVIGWFLLGRRFLLYTFYGTVAMNVFGQFLQFELSFTNDVYAALVGGVLNVAASGIMLRTLGSSGGTDVFAILLKERWNIPIGQFNFLFNATLFLIGAFRLPADLIVASILMMFVASQTLEYVLGMFNRRKLVLVISSRGEEIGEAILASERYGATMIRAKGAYSGTDREILLTVTNNVALKRLENLVYTIDPHALFIVENTFYVSGGQFARGGR